MRYNNTANFVIDGEFNKDFGFVAMIAEKDKSYSAKLYLRRLNNLDLFSLFEINGDTDSKKSKSSVADFMQKMYDNGELDYYFEQINDILGE